MFNTMLTLLGDYTLSSQNKTGCFHSLENIQAYESTV